MRGFEKASATFLVLCCMALTGCLEVRIRGNLEAMNSTPGGQTTAFSLPRKGTLVPIKSGPFFLVLIYDQEKRKGELNFQVEEGLFSFKVEERHLREVVIRDGSVDLNVEMVPIEWGAPIAFHMMYQKKEIKRRVRSETRPCVIPGKAPTDKGHQEVQLSDFLFEIRGRGQFNAIADGVLASFNTGPEQRIETRTEVLEPCH